MYRASDRQWDFPLLSFVGGGKEVERADQWRGDLSYIHRVIRMWGIHSENVHRFLFPSC